MGFARGLLQRNIKHYTNFQDAVNDFKSGKLDAIAGLKSQRLEYLIDYKTIKINTISQDIPQMKSQWIWQLPYQVLIETYLTMWMGY